MILPNAGIEIRLLQYSKTGITEIEERKENKIRKIKTSVIKHEVIKNQNIFAILFFVFTMTD